MISYDDCREDIKSIVFTILLTSSMWTDYTQILQHAKVTREGGFSRISDKCTSQKEHAYNIKEIKSKSYLRFEVSNELNSCVITFMQQVKNLHSGNLW